MVGLTLPPGWTFRPAWQRLLPPGFVQFTAEDSCRYWPSLWRRWLSFRADDAAFAALLTALEALPQAPACSENEIAELLRPHLHRPRNRFFLFLLWFFRQGPRPTALTALPDPSTLVGEEVWRDFRRWHRKYHTDFLALECVQVWQRQPGVRSALAYRGVELQGVLDYALFPVLLTTFFNAFDSEPT